MITPVAQWLRESRQSWAPFAVANNFRLLDVARMAVDEVIAFLDTSRRRVPNDIQLRDAADSITANIREAYGRRKGAERNQFLRYARGSAEETDEHMRTNVASNRVPADRYWRIHNRLIVVCRMLTKLMQE